MIDWQRICWNLRKHAPLSRVAKLVGTDERHLNRLARGDTLQPKFDVGVRLLDLHYDKCPDAHKPEIIGQWQTNSTD